MAAVIAAVMLTPTATSARGEHRQVVAIVSGAIVSGATLDVRSGPATDKGVVGTLAGRSGGGRRALPGVGRPDGQERV
jgi:hypothetical protein